MNIITYKVYVQILGLTKNLMEFNSIELAINYANKMLNTATDIFIIKSITQDGKEIFQECVWDASVDAGVKTTPTSKTFHEQYKMARDQQISAIAILIGNSISWVAEQEDEEEDENSHLLFSQYVANIKNYNAVAALTDYIQQSMDVHSYGYIDNIVDAIRKLLFIDKKKIDEITKSDVFDQLIDIIF